MVWEFYHRLALLLQSLVAKRCKSDKEGIIFNDITRPTPYQTLLPPLLDEINRVPKDQIILINATGTHRLNTQAEQDYM